MWSSLLGMRLCLSPSASTALALVAAAAAAAADHPASAPLADAALCGLHHWCVTAVVAAAVCLLVLLLSPDAVALALA